MMTKLEAIETKNVKEEIFFFLLLFYHFHIYLHVYTLFVPPLPQISTPPTPWKKEVLNSNLVILSRWTHLLKQTCPLV
jgi:hypothetical protein